MVGVSWLILVDDWGKRCIWAKSWKYQRNCKNFWTRWEEIDDSQRSNRPLLQSRDSRFSPKRASILSRYVQNDRRSRKHEIKILRIGWARRTSRNDWPRCWPPIHRHRNGRAAPRKQNRVSFRWPLWTIWINKAATRWRRCRCKFSQRQRVLI